MHALLSLCRSALVENIRRGIHHKSRVDQNGRDRDQHREGIFPCAAALDAVVNSDAIAADRLDLSHHRAKKFWHYVFFHELPHLCEWDYPSTSRNFSSLNFRIVDAIARARGKPATILRRPSHVPQLEREAQKQIPKTYSRWSAFA